MKSRLKSVFMTSTLYYTLISLVMYSLGALLSNGQMIPKLSVMYLILLFSVVISLANQIFRTKISVFGKYACHFLAVGVVYYVLFISISGNSTVGTKALVGIGLYVFLYILVAFICFLVRAICARRKDEKIPYQSQF